MMVSNTGLWGGGHSAVAKAVYMRVALGLIPGMKKERSWRDVSAAKVLAVQVGGPEFRSPALINSWYGGTSL